MKRYLPIILLFIILIIFATKKIWYRREDGDYTIEIYQGSVEEGFAFSNLYAPSNLREEEISSSSITLAWDFEEKNLMAKSGLDPKYTDHSGFRIYRDGFWLEDILGKETKYTDTGLFPGETYKYQVVALTFDDKVEGQRSEEIQVTTADGLVNSINNLPKEEYEVLLVEGASVAEGQRVPPGTSFGDQVAEYLIEESNPNLVYVNRAVSGAFTSEVAERIGREIEELKVRENLSPDLIIADTAGINYLIASGTLLAKVRGNHSMVAFRENVEKIIEEVQPSNERTLILININYFACCKNEDEDSVDRNHKKRVAWNKVIRDIANEYRFILVDVEKAMVDSGKADSILLADAIHPSHTGHIFMTRAIIEAIESHRR